MRQTLRQCRGIIDVLLFHESAKRVNVNRRSLLSNFETEQTPDLRILELIIHIDLIVLL